MSGGVDSSVAAWLLQQQGFEIVGLFMRNGVHVDEGEARIRLVWAEALRAAGQLDEAHQAIVAAKQRLEERAARIGSPALRASYLENVPENARTLALAAAWAGT